MIPAPFEYHSPRSLDEAISLLARYGEDARVLAGGHSLIPMMKLRLAEAANLGTQEHAWSALQRFRQPFLLLVNYLWCEIADPPVESAKSG